MSDCGNVETLEKSVDKAFEAATEDDMDDIEAWANRWFAEYADTQQMLKNLKKKARNPTGFRRTVVHRNICVRPYTINKGTQLWT